MKRRILSLVIAILFTAGVFIVPAAVAAKGGSGQTLTQEQQGQKHTAKKSDKKSAKKNKKKSKTTELSSKKKSKSKKHQNQQT